jgi:mannose-1-phosphate guanylyltransferase
VRSTLKSKGLLKVDRFFEKPDLKTAKRYLSHGGYFWNSGIFVFKTSQILTEIRTHLPGLHDTLKKIRVLLFEPAKPVESSIPQSSPSVAEQLRRTGAISNPQLGTLYSRLKPVSLDYGIMEHSSKILMVPAKFRWSDLGSWAALDEVIEKDKTGNILRKYINIGAKFRLRRRSARYTSA